MSEAMIYGAMIHTMLRQLEEVLDYAWEKIAGVNRNEPLDCALYSLAAAHLAGLTRIRWSSLEANLTSETHDESEADRPTVKTVNKKLRRVIRKRKANTFTTEI